MPTIVLNQSNHFRANVTANVTPTVFLVNGSTADCLVYMPPGGALVGSVNAVTAGNVAKVNGALAGHLIQVQINPMNAVLGNATVTY